MIVQAKGYELFSQEINPAISEELETDVHLSNVKEKGNSAPPSCR